MPLKLKLSLIVTVLLTLTVILVSAMLLRQQQKTLTAEMVKRGLTIAQNLAASAKQSLVSDDDLTLNLLVKDAMKDPDVAYVAITDEKGKALAHSDVGLVGRRLERAAPLAPLGNELLVQTYEVAGTGELIDFSLPLTFRNVRVGALYLGFSQRSIAAALARARNNATVLFCDVRGFTSISERVPPEEVVAMLNAFYTLMIDTTFKYDGTLDKFLGDGVMAVFGAPIYHGDHSLRAVRTALAMQAGMRELSARRVTEDKAPLTIGIGINAGDAVAGSVGTEARMEYTVVGDSVNLAARLECAGKPGRTLSSGPTYARVRDAVQARALGPMKVKGKEEEIDVYAVVGVRGA